VLTTLFTQSNLSTPFTSRNGKAADMKVGKGFNFVSLGTLTILFKVGLLKRQAHIERLLVIGKLAEKISFFFGIMTMR